MWDRRFLFSDQRTIDKLRGFIPAVGNTHEIQNRTTPGGRWFLDAIAEINSRPAQGQTSQGFYVLGADGSGYAFNNNRSVERVLGFLDRGMSGFVAKPPKQAEVGEMRTRAVEPPEGTLIVRVYARIHPTPEGCHDSNKNLQRDHFWILPSERKALAGGEVPEGFRLRLLRFALVDAVRGEPGFWRANEIVSSDFSADVSGAGVAISGSYTMRAAGREQTLQGTIELQLKAENGQITSVTGLAEATATGSSRWTPNPPEGEFPLKIAFVMPEPRSPIVAPQAASTGNQYLSPQ